MKRRYSSIKKLGSKFDYVATISAVRGDFDLLKRDLREHEFFPLRRIQVGAMVKIGSFGVRFALEEDGLLEFDVFGKERQYRNVTKMPRTDTNSFRENIGTLVAPLIFNGYEVHARARIPATTEDQSGGYKDSFSAPPNLKFSSERVDFREFDARYNNYFGTIVCVGGNIDGFKNDFRKNQFTRRTPMLHHMGFPIDVLPFLTEDDTLECDIYGGKTSPSSQVFRRELGQVTTPILKNGFTISFLEKNL